MMLGIDMKVPAITQLSNSEILNLATGIEQGFLQQEHRAIVAETLVFCKSLMEDLKNSKINIYQLKQMLGFHSERLKKEMLKR